MTMVTLAARSLTHCSSLGTYTQNLLGWRPDQTESMLRAVLNRQQKRALSSSSPTARITAYFPPIQNEDRSDENPVNVLPPSKRARRAISQLLTKDAANSGEKPSSGMPSTSECTLPEELQQLPYRKRQSRRRITQCGTEKSTAKTTRQRRSTQKRSSRQVVDHVALSEEEQDSVI
ncbi:unnamed protein product [Dicrocoelium dendriticum]|nr:unnamed protein product [Dicrocoelium dendriticum]